MGFAGSLLGGAKIRGGAMNQYIGTIQTKVKASSASLTLLIVKIYSGLIIGVTLSLIGEEIFGFGTLSFSFVSVVALLGFLKISKSWGWAPLLVFDLICLLVGLLLRMYVMVAPGA